MKDLDIRLLGRSWTAAEMARYHELPGRLELMDGWLCFYEQERLDLLGALIEHVGTARTVLCGPLDVWKTAIRQRERDEDEDKLPAAGDEQFVKTAQRLSFAKQRGFRPKLKKRQRG